MTIVIDTNIIVSALLCSSGSSYLFLDKVFGGEFEVFVSEAIMSEYEEVLHRKKFGFDDELVDFILQWFRSNAVMVDVNNEDYPKDLMIDPKDAPFYVVARCTKSRLITGNIKHYPVEEMRTMLWEIINID